MAEGHGDWPGNTPHFRQELNRIIESERTARSGLFGGGEVDRRYNQWAQEGGLGGYDQYGGHYGRYGPMDSMGRPPPPPPPLPSQDEDERRPKLIEPQRKPWLKQVMPENMKEELLVAARGRLRRVGIPAKDLGFDDCELSSPSYDALPQQSWQFEGHAQSAPAVYSNPPPPGYSPQQRQLMGRPVSYGDGYPPDQSRGYQQHPAQGPPPAGYHMPDRGQQPTIGDLMNIQQHQQRRRSPSASRIPRPVPQKRSTVGAAGACAGPPPGAGPRAPPRPPRRIDCMPPIPEHPDHHYIMQQGSRPVPAARNKSFIPRPALHASSSSERQQIGQQQQQWQQQPQMPRQHPPGQQPYDHQQYGNMGQQGPPMAPPRASVRDLTPRIPVPAPEPKPPRNWTPPVRTCPPDGDYMGHPAQQSVRGMTPGPPMMGGVGPRDVNPTHMRASPLPDLVLHRGPSMISNSSCASSRTTCSYNPPSLSMAPSANDVSGPRPLGASVSNLRQNSPWQPAGPPRPMGMHMTQQQQQFHNHPQQHWQPYQQGPHHGAMGPGPQQQEYYEDEDYYQVKTQSSRYKPDFQEVLQKFNGGQAFSRKNGGDGYGDGPGGYGAY